jgi:hypothetical protein
MIGGDKFATGLWFATGLVKRQIRSGQTDAVHGSIQPAFQRFGRRMQRELDAR